MLCSYLNLNELIVQWNNHLTENKPTKCKKQQQISISFYISLWPRAFAYRQVSRPLFLHIDFYFNIVDGMHVFTWYTMRFIMVMQYVFNKMVAYFPGEIVLTAAFIELLLCQLVPTEKVVWLNKTQYFRANCLN